MITPAKEEAARRKSSVQFIEADILVHDLGQGRYDLISCFGNSISDFPLSDFAKPGKKIVRALKPGGRFVLDFYDGSYDFMQGRSAPEGVYQEAPERITFRYKGHLPKIGAWAHIIRNETRGEEYERKGYIYTVPVVSLALCDSLDLERHIVLNSEESHYSVREKQQRQATLLLFVQKVQERS